MRVKTLCESPDSGRTATVHEKRRITSRRSSGSVDGYMKSDDEGSGGAREIRKPPSGSTGRVGITVLIVGATAEILWCARKMLEPRGIVARTTTLEQLRDDAMRLRPLMLIVNVSECDYDPEALATLAHDAEMRIGMVTDAKEAESVLERLIAVVGPNVPARPPDAPRPRLELDTARMSANALQEAIDRMGGRRFEPVTAKYDAKTITDAIERMSAEEKAKR